MRDFDEHCGNTVKTIAFFVILILLFGLLSLKTERALLNSDRLVPVRNKNIYRIQREPDDSIDVIILGDSLSYSSISPMRLWKDHGFTAFVCGQSGQEIRESEEMLRMALRSQTPRIVILETNAMFRTHIEARNLNDVLEAGLNYYIPVFRGHDTWKSLVMKKEYEEENYKGFALRCGVKPYEKGNYMTNAGQREVLPDTTLTHMENIIAMCEDAGAELILLGTPSPCNYNYAKHEALAAYAGEHSLVLFDMNLHPDETGIDWKTDTLDQGDHLNLSGAEKATTYLGKFLAEKYDLPDHRGDPKYASWAAESDVYEKKASDNLKEIRGNRR